MKNLFLAFLVLASLNVGAQTLHRDSILSKRTYCNVTLTDSVNGIYNLPAKLTVKGLGDDYDSVNGAYFYYNFYSVVSLTSIFSGNFPIAGKAYEDWDANSNEAPYLFTQAALKSKKIQVTFKP